jgi:O-antigen ligase
MSKNVIPSSYDRQTVWFLPLVFLLLLFVLFVAKTGWVFQVSMILIFLISSFGSFILIPHQIQQNEKDLILVGLSCYFGLLLIDYLTSSLVTQMVMQHAGPELERYNIFLASNTSLMYVNGFVQPFVLVVFGLMTYFREQN